jgi:hypothetical protein
MSQATETSGVIETEEFPLENFFRPSQSLTTRICDRIDFLEAAATNEIAVRERSDLEEANSYGDEESHKPSTDTDDEIFIQQRLIAEELDGCLIDSADTPSATSGEQIDIQQVVIDGMADALGLESSDPLLSELASEFQNWLDGVVCYTAGWGEIISTGGGQMYLEMFGIDEEETVEPDYTFTGSYKSKPKPEGNILNRLAAKLGVF